MQVFSFNALETNLMYLVIEQSVAVLIDPIEPQKIKDFLNEKKLSFSSIISLTTHHHLDHSGGNIHLEALFPGIKIYAGSNKSFSHHICKDKDAIEEENMKIQCISTPCHTLDSISYYITSSSSDTPCLFTGDTLFYLGCGKFFEGSPQMMVDSLSKLLSCPPNTLIYYGHDYKENNLRFRKEIVSPPVDLPESIFLSVEQEKKYNLFANPSLLDNLEEFKSLSHVERVALLRRKKDAFK
ncbi:hydroxyacylglutathione hydrolase [Nematocida sp. LUAm3]|nr:hydroxyacylglutathione hydrolase [Nematocida sp. LUAm3]KAI5174793.1 hydroxyacylglutathione hydrolase [Nematocida sp. LUAm2]KAI5177796.1 hydroxyacylglutathione hydrolase [Nematocida sp. LUAm1]